MKLMKTVLKIVALPVILVMTVLQWIGIIVTSCSKLVTRIAAFLLFLIAAAGYLIDPSAAWQAVNFGVLAIVILLLPYLAERLIYRITDLNYCLRQFIRSRP